MKAFFLSPFVRHKVSPSLTGELSNPHSPQVVGQGRKESSENSDTVYERCGAEAEARSRWPGSVAGSFGCDPRQHSNQHAAIALELSTPDAGIASGHRSPDSLTYPEMRA